MILAPKEFYTIEELLALPLPPPPKPKTPPPAAAPSLADAVAKWNAEHPLDVPRAGGDCPICGHHGCFGRFPDDANRWHCFSTDHRSVGVRGASGYHGDALDLEAHVRGCKPVDVLRADGYIALAPVAQIQGPTRRIRRNNSPLAAVDILENDQRNLLGDRRLELNEMTGRSEIGRQPLTDDDVFEIRTDIELTYPGGVDKDGNQVGLKISTADMHAACNLVAKRNSYHPVRDYLINLAWDGVERLDSVAEDLLGAERSPLNIAMLRRWFISAVARAMRPGSKVDTMLVLVGPQGALKSTWFRTLASPAWFQDTAVDIHNKDSFQVLRSAWIYEWAELEALKRARDAAATKAFLSSAVDTYRPSYGRLVIDVPRSCVIVGTSNPDEFLTDETGNRRFWPLRVGHIDLDATRQQRDQLWAEAVRLYSAGERWWFDTAESAELAGRHDEHTVRDAWESVVVPWAMRHPEGFTLGDVLSGALDKPSGQWTRGDEMRVARILRMDGWTKQRPHRGGMLWKR